MVALGETLPIKPHCHRGGQRSRKLLGSKLGISLWETGFMGAAGADKQQVSGKRAHWLDQPTVTLMEPTQQPTSLIHPHLVTTQYPLLPEKYEGEPVGCLEFL